MEQNALKQKRCNCRLSTTDFKVGHGDVLEGFERNVCVDVVLARRLQIKGKKTTHMHAYIKLEAFKNL